jgi:hypothetical protein
MNQENNNTPKFIAVSNDNKTEPQFYRFQVFQGKRNTQGKVERTKTVGMTYHQAGHENYTLRLWTFVHERFYLLNNHKQAGRYFIMAREENKQPNPKSKYFWNIIGSGRVDTSAGVIELEFDLFDKPLYMNIFPEAQANSSSFADFEEMLKTA